jgi:hypothetical protein
MPWVPVSQVQREMEIEDIREERTFEVARNMLAKGYTVKDIGECTGLDEEDILALG